MKKQVAQKSGFQTLFTTILDTVFSSVKDYVITGVIDTFEGLFDHIEERVLQLQRKLMQQVVIKLFLLLGLLALVASLAFYMLQVLHWQPFLILLIVGVVFLVIASVCANMWRR